MGKIFNLQRFSTHDGPGIRTTVFFKGCPLRCKWCHNPEGLSFEAQAQHFKQKCISCGACKGEISLESVNICPAHAIKACGYEMTAEEIISLALKDKPYYAHHGGITFSGGECLAQPELLLKCLDLAKNHRLHTAIDTSGYAPREVLKATLSSCDLYLYDVKCIDPELHKRFTGCDNSIILDNLKFLSGTGKPIWIRIPIIVGFNASLNQMKAIATLLNGLDNIENVTLMPYHSLGKSKYESLGMTSEHFDAPDSLLMQKLNDCFKKWN